MSEPSSASKRRIPSWIGVLSGGLLALPGYALISLFIRLFYSTPLHLGIAVLGIAVLAVVGMIGLLLLARRFAQLALGFGLSLIVISIVVYLIAPAGPGYRDAEEFLSSLILFGAYSLIAPIAGAAVFAVSLPRALRP